MSGFQDGREWEARTKRRVDEQKEGERGKIMDTNLREEIGGQIEAWRGRRNSRWKWVEY